MKNLREEGIFELITGPMFSGKTTTLVNRLEELNGFGCFVKCFKPVIDNRYGKNQIVSHGGLTIEAIVIDESIEILAHIGDSNVVLIDEIQFFDATIVGVILELLNRKIHVIAAGLAFDYMGNYFGKMQQLIELSNSLTQLTGLCNICNGVGTHTYRKNKMMIDTVLIGSDDLYEIRCKTCYELEQ